MQEITKIIDNYNSSYRRRINPVDFINKIISAKIFIEIEDGYKFKNRSLLSYFVACAINRRMVDSDSNIVEDVKIKFQNLLEELCFGINSDIIMFLVLITDNVRFIDLIQSSAIDFFNNIPEFSFEKNNIKLLNNVNIQISNNPPTNEDRKKREEKLSEIEKGETNRQISLVNDYDYKKEDINTDLNIMLKSIKYIEILCKILPCFFDNLKAKEQDKIVELIYKLPNKFIYNSLKEFDNNYEKLVHEVLNEVTFLKKEKEVSIISIQNLISNIASTIVISIYMGVAFNASNAKTIRAFNAFNFSDNENYKIMNLMMEEKGNGFAMFYDKAKTLLNSKHKLVVALTKLTIHNYFLNHVGKITSEGQSLLDLAFKNNKIKTNTIKGNAKNRMLYK